MTVKFSKIELLTYFFLNVQKFPIFSDYMDHWDAIQTSKINSFHPWAHCASALNGFDEKTWILICSFVMFLFNYDLHTPYRSRFIVESIPSTRGILTPSHINMESMFQTAKDKDVFLIFEPGLLKLLPDISKSILFINEKLCDMIKTWTHLVMNVLLCRTVLMCLVNKKGKEMVICIYVSWVKSKV